MNIGQRHCVKFTTQRTRVAVEEHRSGAGWVVRVIQPAVGQTVAIRSSRHDSWDAARDAFVREVIAVGDTIMKEVHLRLKQALKVWKCGRVGIRPGSGAAFSQVLAVSANVVEVALPCARTIQSLIDNDKLLADSFSFPEWLVCALADLHAGLSDEDAGRRMAVSLRG